MNAYGPTRATKYLVLSRLPCSFAPFVQFRYKEHTPGRGICQPKSYTLALPGAFLRRAFLLSKALSANA